MAKVKFSPNFGKFTAARIARLARVAITDQKLIDRVKNKLLLKIKKEGLLPSDQRVKSLKVKTVKQRRRLSAFNKTSKYFKNFFSNLTFTGQFLNSFRGIIKKTKTVEYEIGPTGNHKGIKSGTGKKGKSISNSELGQYLISGGRDYTQVSNRNLKEIAKSVKARIIKELKLNL